jgi:hypothetical protein
VGDCFELFPVKGSTRGKTRVIRDNISENELEFGVDDSEGDGRVEEDAREFVGSEEMNEG